MNLGLGSYALAWAIGVPGSLPPNPLDVFGFVDKAAEHGFGLVQIADNLPLHSLGAADLESLRTHTRALGLSVEVGTRGVTDGNLERYLELAQRFASPIVRVVVDSEDHHPDPDEVIRRARAVLPLYEKAGVTLAIENHDRFSAQTLVALVEALASPSVGICLDTVNSFGALEGPEVVIDTLAPFVVNLHVKDFAIRREPHNMGFRIFGTPAGEGVLDIPGLLERFARRDTVTASLELWPPPENSVSATVAKEERWLKQSALYLQALTKA